MIRLVYLDWVRLTREVSDEFGDLRRSDNGYKVTPLIGDWTNTRLDRRLDQLIWI